jgi:hypothetical protein
VILSKLVFIGKESQNFLDACCEQGLTTACEVDIILLLPMLRKISVSCLGTQLFRSITRTINNIGLVAQPMVLLLPLRKKVKTKLSVPSYFLPPPCVSLLQILYLIRADCLDGTGCSAGFSTTAR